MAASAHALTLTAPALAEQDRQSREAEAAAERAVITHAPTVTSDGLPVPALAGGIVLAFAVGLTAGKVHRRRVTARRHSVARERPVPVTAAPARPAPPPPEPAAQIASQPIEAPPAPAAPAPPPPEARTEPPRVVAPPTAPATPPPPPEPPRVVAPPSAPAPPPPEPPRREAAETEPLRLVSQGPKRDAPLSQAPEVPRAQEPPTEPADPAAPLTDAPEALRTPPIEPRGAAAPGRRFARVASWPEEAERLWTCEIGWKPGYRKSSFRAMAGPPGAGKRRPIGDSPAVRWTLMGDPEPPTPELAVRVRALVHALEAAGWEHIGRGQHWYAQRFVWRGGGEPQPLAVPDIAEPAER